MLMLYRFLFTVVVIFSLVHAQQGWLGIVFRDITIIEKTGTSTAFLIEKVIPGSGAIESGIQSGDTLIGVSGNRIYDRSRLHSELGRFKPGDQVELWLKKHGQQAKAMVRMQKRPENLTSLVGTLTGSQLPYRGETYANSNQLNDKPKLILLEFWATWCGACRNSRPILNKIYSKYSGRGLEVAGISREPISKLKHFQNEFPVRYPQMADVSGEIQTRYGVSALPTYFLLDANGYVLRSFRGGMSEKSWESEIESWLK
jgi:peroxiredoxin